MNMKKTLFSLAVTLLAITALAGPDGALKFTRLSPGGSTAWVAPAGARITTTAFVVEFWIKLAAGADSIGEMQVFDQDISGSFVIKHHHDEQRLFIMQVAHQFSDIGGMQVLYLGTHQLLIFAVDELFQAVHIFLVKFFHRFQFSISGYSRKSR